MDYLTDTIFKCPDGQVTAHRMILAAASPFLKDIMSQDLADEVVIIVPDVPAIVMTTILDLVYKGRMNITPYCTWAIRSLVQLLRIDAEDVSVITAKKQPLLVPPLAVDPISPLIGANQTPSPSNGRISRKRKSESIPATDITPKAARGMNGTPASKGKKKSKKGRASITNPFMTPNPEEIPGEPTSGFHDLDDVETWVCAICQCYDPVITSPIKNPQQSALLMTTEWIGCDCNRWYHKYCTKLKHIDDSFSCKQLKKRMSTSIIIN